MIRELSPADAMPDHAVVGSPATCWLAVKYFTFLRSWFGLKWGKASYFEGGIRCSRQNITRANG